MKSQSERIYARAAVPFQGKGLRLDANADSADLYIYETIGSDWWGNGVTAAGVADELKSLKDSVQTINCHVNSPGGDVFDGVAIYNQLAQHKATVNMFVDGLAASAASVIACAGDTIQIAENAMIMIHNPWAVVLGEAKDMRKMADTMDKIKETLVLTYQKRSGQMASDISRWMDEETWLTGQEAVDKGFATAVMPSKAANSMLGKFAAHYRNTPATLTAPPKPDFDEVADLRRRLNLLMQSH